MEVVKDKVKEEETKSEFKDEVEVDEEVEKEKILENSVVPKNQFHVKDKKLKNETRRGGCFFY